MNESRLDEDLKALSKRPRPFLRRKRQILVSILQTNSSAAMKKGTNPLALDLRAGGFEVFPIAKLFDLRSNVWYPSILMELWRSHP
jgi:hypothetical protein